MMVSSKPKCFNHLFIYLFYITDFSELSFTASGRCTSNSEHSVRTQSRVPNNDEHKWTPRPEERKQAKREREREINGLQGNVSEAERGKKDVYICSSMQSTHVCVWEPSVMYSRQQWWMQPFLQSPVLSLQGYLLALSACGNQAGLVHYSLLRWLWKRAALRINL